MVTGALARGGAERQMFALVQGLRSRGWDVEVLELIGVAAGQPSFEEEFKRAGVKLIETPLISADPALSEIPTALRPFTSLFPDTLPQMCGALRHAYEEFRPYVLHCWSDLANVVGGFSAGAIGIARIVLGLRTYPPNYYCDPVAAYFYRDAYRILLRNAAVVCLNNSNASKETYERWIGVSPNTVRQVYNGFLSSDISVPTRTQGAECRTRLGLPPDCVTVGGMMRFSPEKDPYLWLETAALIGSQRPDVHFILAGYGHDNIAEKLLRHASDLGLANRLIMPGAIANVVSIYGALDVFLLTSRFENIPNVLIEAQASGIPVVAPAVGGIPETILDGVTGRLVAKRSASALAAAVLLSLDMRQQTATAGPAFVAARFGHDRMIQETIAVYLAAVT